jgi:hypothetical protein
VALARLNYPPEVPPHLGAPWAELLTAMTATDPSRRPTARDVADALAQPAEGPPGGPTPTRPLPAPRSIVTRRRVVALVGVLVVAALAAVLAVSGVRRAPAAVSTPPAYPAVAGRLGSDLHRLEQAIEGSATAAMTAQLREDVLAVATAAARHNYQTADSMIGALNADLAAGREAGTLSRANVKRIRAALAAAQAALGAAVASPAPTAAVASPAPTATVTVTPSPRQAAAPSPSQRVPAGDVGGKVPGNRHGRGHEG